MAVLVVKVVRYSIALDMHHSHVMGRHGGSRTKGGRTDTLLLLLLFVGSSYGFLMGGGEPHYKEKQSEFQGIDTLLQREMQCEMSPRCKCKAWSLSSRNTLKSNCYGCSGLI